MYKLKNQIEGQIQEIVFFMSLLIAFTTFISGVCYLALSPESLGLVLGTFGASIDRGLFSFVGFGFFYLAVISLHMGYITNFHVFNFRDFKREYPVLTQSLLAHTIILTLFTNILSVIQLSLDIGASQSLPNGSGGAVGSFIAKGLYSVAGVYGSLFVLLSFIFVTCLIASFFEITDVQAALKKTARFTKINSIKAIQLSNHYLMSGLQFLLKGNDISDMALQSSSATKVWLSNSVHRANNLFTEHFHIYKKEEHKEASSPILTQTHKTTETKTTKTIKKIGPRTASEKLLGRFKKLPSITPVKATAKPVIASKKAVAIQSKQKTKKSDKIQTARK